MSGVAVTQSIVPGDSSDAGSEAYLLRIDALAATVVPLPRTGALLVGRGDDADVRIDHAAVSRRHARFTTVNGSVTVTDLGSHNGTYVNGARLEGGRTLGKGDDVQV